MFSQIHVRKYYELPGLKMSILARKHVEGGLGQQTTCISSLMAQFDAGHLVLCWSEVRLATDMKRLHNLINH